MRAKRKTKDQQLAALEARLTDIFAGAAGYILEEDGDHASAENLENIIPACCMLFDIADDSYLRSPRCLSKWRSPQNAAVLLFDAGVRA